MSENTVFPGSYEAAVRALEECAAVDECATWPDQVAAMASYAKQADDDEMMRMIAHLQRRARWMVERLSDPDCPWPLPKSELPRWWKYRSKREAKPRLMRRKNRPA